MRGIGDACAATDGAAATLSKTRPSSLATFASAAPTSVLRRHDPGARRDSPSPPALNGFSAIDTSNFDSRKRAASSASCPVSLSR